MRLGSSVPLAALRSLGRAFVEVLKAEWAALIADLGASGRRLARGLIILGLSIVLLGWVAGLASLALVAYLNLFLEMWQAAVIVAAGLLLIAFVLFLWGKSTLAGVKRPSELVQTRVEGHVEWLRSQVDTARSADEESEDAVHGA